MSNIVRAFLSENIILVIAALLALVLTAIWKARGWTKDVDWKITGLIEGQTNLKDMLSEVKSAVADLRNNLDSKPAIKSTSPLSLTEYGEELSKGIDADSLASLYVDKLEPKVTGKNAYEIQQYCFKYAETLLLEDLQKLNKEKYDAITNFAFDAGISTDKLMRVVGIMLRDKLLDMTAPPR